MKRLFTVIVAILISCSFMCVCGEENADAWYQITSGSVLTVWLPGNTADGMDWNFEISSPPHFELLTHEVLEGEPGEDGGVPTTYAASFRGFSGEEANVSIIFTYAAEGDELPRSTRAFEMKLDADSNITLLSVTKRDPEAEWMEYNPDERMITLNLPDDGDEWTISRIEDRAAGIIRCEFTEGVCMASYSAAEGFTGDAEISFASGDDEIFTVVLHAEEDGELRIRYVEEFIVCE